MLGERDIATLAELIRREGHDAVLLACLDITYANSRGGGGGGGGGIGTTVNGAAGGWTGGGGGAGGHGTTFTGGCRSSR